MQSDEDVSPGRASEKVVRERVEGERSNIEVRSFAVELERARLLAESSICPSPAGPVVPWIGVGSRRQTVIAHPLTRAVQLDARR